MSLRFSVDNILGLKDEKRKPDITKTFPRSENGEITANEVDIEEVQPSNNFQKIMNLISAPNPEEFSRMPRASVDVSHVPSTAFSMVSPLCQVSQWNVFLPQIK